jgi:hypothetical protein
MPSRTWAALAATILFLANAAASAPPDAPSAAGGIRWTVPAGWTAEKTNPMRVATYAVPAAKGTDPGECAVFFFGTGQGGGVDENIERWAKQFEGRPPASRSKKTVSGMAVSLAEVEGTYLNPGGGLMLSQGKKPGYHLLGAIVEAPQGRVFFKMTGPAATVAAARVAFDSLVGSIVKK